jgi:hypothetical protein
MHRGGAIKIAEDIAMTVATEWEPLYRENGVSVRNFSEWHNSFRQSQRYLRAHDLTEDDITCSERMA